VNDLMVNPALIRELLSTQRRGLSRSLPESGFWFAAEYLLDSSPRALARVARQVFSIEKTSIGNFRGRRKPSRQELLYHVECYMIAAEDLLVGVKSEEFRLLGESDRRFFQKLTGQSLMSRLSPLDPAPGQQPPWRIAVPYEENSSLSIDHQGPHAERHAPGPAEPLLHRAVNDRFRKLAGHDGKSHDSTENDRKFSASKLALPRLLCFLAVAAIPLLLTLIPGIFPREP
jgi:hypothetical protein